MNLFRTMAVLLFAYAFMPLSFASTRTIGFVDYERSIASSVIVNSLIKISPTLKNSRIEKYTDKLFKNSLANTKRQAKYVKPLIMSKRNKNTSCKSCHLIYDPGRYI